MYLCVLNLLFIIFLLQYGQGEGQKIRQCLLFHLKPEGRSQERTLDDPCSVVFASSKKAFQHPARVVGSGIDLSNDD